MMEVIKSEDCIVRVENRLPCISIELSNGVQVYSTAASKSTISLNTTASQSVSFNYPKDEGTFDPEDSEEDGWLRAVLPETYNTKLVEGKPVTVAMEGID